MRPNVVFITLDCARMDYLGCYGKKSVKTPNIDYLAENGVIVEKAYTHCPLTGPAHLTLFTSRLPFDHGLRFNSCKSRDDFPKMAQLFKDNQYQTAAFIGGFVLDRQFGFDRGFDCYDDSMVNRLEQVLLRAVGYYKLWSGIKVDKFSRSAARITNHAIQWLKEASRQKPFFLWLHYFDCHDQFKLPQPFHYLYYRRRGYRDNIEYIDRHFGRLLTWLKRHDMFDNTLLVIFSDHGESLNDYKFNGKPYRGHSNIAYDVTLRVPLIFYGPNIARGHRSRQLFRLIDILPTMINLCGLKVDRDIYMEGINLTEYLQHDFPPQDLEVYAETLVPTVKKLPEWRILIRLPWKYVFWPQTQEEFLYNTENDPYEEKNIISSHPDIAQDMKRRLLQIIEKDKNIPRPDYDEKVASALKALGYM